MASFQVAPAPWTDLLDWSLDGDQGLVRKTMEDGAVAATLVSGGHRFHVFGVLDGHGGAETMRYASKHFVPILYESLKTVEPHVALAKTFLRLDEQIRNNVIDRSGSTLSVVLIREHPWGIWCANVGDSAIFQRFKDTMQRVTTNHNLETKVERQRILNHKVLVLEPNGYVRDPKGNMLNMTKSLGDFDFKPGGVSARPTVKKIEDVECLILSSDGFTDVIPLRSMKSRWKTLGANAVAWGHYRRTMFETHDNTTICILQFKGKPNKEHASLVDAIERLQVF